MMELIIAKKYNDFRILGTDAGDCHTLGCFKLTVKVHDVYIYFILSL